MSCIVCSFLHGVYCAIDCSTTVQPFGAPAVPPHQTGIQKAYLMNYIVMDLEWNQCPYGKKREDPKMPFEIIEIGAVKVDDSFTPQDTFHEIVRPVLYTRLHHCTRTVIHMTEEDFRGKRSFPEVFTDFLAWCGNDPLFCTWGPGDLTELQRNAAWHIARGTLGGPWPFAYPLFFRDIQKIFSHACEDGRSRRSLQWAVEFLNLSEEEQFHGAYADAVYTAEVLRRIPRDMVERYSSIDTYITPKSRAEEIFVRYDTYTKFISRSYRDRDDVMKDRVITATRCPDCGKKAPRKIRWFSENGRNFLSVSLCPDHGLIKGKIRIRQNAEGEWFAIRTIRKITPEEMETVRKKKEAVRLKRKARTVQPQKA